MTAGKIALAGNPNVGKSTVFNSLTGMKQHTGNWSGKTVSTAEGSVFKGGKEIRLIDLPGSYSLSADSAEEEVTRDFLCFETFDGAVVVCDACCLERNLVFAFQVAQLVPKTVLCVNMMDDARRKGIEIDIHALSEETGLPAVGISAANGEGMDELKELIFSLAEGKILPEFISPRYPENIKSAVFRIVPVLEKDYGFSGIFPAFEILKNEHGFVSEFEKRFGKIHKSKKLSTVLSETDIPNDIGDKISACNVFHAEEICLSAVKSTDSHRSFAEHPADSVLTGKIFGIPIMLGLFGFIFWLTVSGANFPSELLSAVFSKIGIWLEQAFSSLGFHPVLKSMLIDGIWNVMSWVVAVMLPPMAIFFPLFTILEDIGYLPRVAFNLDRGFRSSGACGKQALTMWLVYKRFFPHIFLRRCF